MKVFAWLLGCGGLALSYLSTLSIYGMGSSYELFAIAVMLLGLMLLVESNTRR